MAYWLMKSEPDEFSIDDLKRLSQSRWDGVRNYQARNFVRTMEDGDQFLFYHSSCAIPGIAGIGRICSSAYPDPSALDPQSAYFDGKASPSNNPWAAIDVGFVERFRQVLPLPRLKAHPALTELPLVKKGSRLSVMPVSPSQWQAILALAAREATVRPGW